MSWARATTWARSITSTMSRRLARPRTHRAWPPWWSIPFTPERCYVGTDNRGIFKSTNCGADWVKINTGKGAAVLDGGTLYTVELDPTDPNLIYAASLYSSDSSLYQSKNGGVDFEPLFPPGSLVAETVEYNFFQSMGMDPSDHRHVVVTFHANCKGQYAPSCLGETIDSGKTWRLFKSPLDSWGEAASSMVFGSKSWVLATSQNGTYDTNDSGASWKKVGPGAYGAGHAYRSSDGYYYTGSDYGLQRSSRWLELGNDQQHVPELRGHRRRKAHVLQQAQRQAALLHVERRRWLDLDPLAVSRQHRHGRALRLRFGPPRPLLEPPQDRTVAGGDVLIAMLRSLTGCRVTRKLRHLDFA